MKLNVGAGSLRLDGFDNVDVRALGEDVRVGHAADLSFAADRSVEVLFSHAVFEHVYLAHQLAVLREWKRVLAPRGAIVCLGIPDFEAVATAYVARQQGVTAEVFDLFEAYRYTHGHPEHQTDVEWPTWEPAAQADSAPAGYVPQLHKALFDAGHVASLLRAVGLPASLLRYAYPGEEPLINLGFVAGWRCNDQAVAERRLLAIPGVGRFVRPETISWHAATPSAGDRFVEEIARLEQRAPAWWRRTLAHSCRPAARWGGAARRLLRGIRAPFR